ncbi:MAG: hypothetical protein VX896_01870 [Candidatus Neomarinimicrobiota bacterium]|nr:hypothetical protein [Candidatus Neomarinimicrobiota bacterium]MED5248008.1 hypothetical protein [Candidatus Neomarinimicrobiota bacterium]
MNIRKIFAVSIVLLMSTQVLFANYAFYRKVANTFKFYRIPLDEKKMSLTENADGSYQFSIELTSTKRNDFEMPLLVAFISVGQAINHQKTFAKKKPGYNPVIPGNTAVTVYIPITRQNTVISAKATADQVSQLTDGKVDAAGFMRLIKDSIETL